MASPQSSKGSASRSTGYSSQQKKNTGLSVNKQHTSQQLKGGGSACRGQAPRPVQKEETRPSSFPRRGYSKSGSVTDGPPSEVSPTPTLPTASAPRSSIGAMDEATRRAILAKKQAEMWAKKEAAQKKRALEATMLAATPPSRATPTVAAPPGGWGAYAPGPPPIGTSTARPTAGPASTSRRTPSPYDSSGASSPDLEEFLTPAYMDKHLRKAYEPPARRLQKFGRGAYEEAVKTGTERAAEKTGWDRAARGETDTNDVVTTTHRGRRQLYRALKKAHARGDLHSDAGIRGGPFESTGAQATTRGGGTTTTPAGPIGMGTLRLQGTKGKGEHWVGYYKK